MAEEEGRGSSPGAEYPRPTGVAPSRPWCLRNQSPFDWRRTEADRRKLSTRHQRYCACVRAQSLVRFMASNRRISNSLARNPRRCFAFSTCRSNFSRLRSQASASYAPRRAAGVICETRVMHSSPRIVQDTQSRQSCQYRRAAPNFVHVRATEEGGGTPRRTGTHETNFQPVAARR